MKIDFTMSIDDWLDFIGRFIAVFTDFLSGLNVNLFKESE